MRLSVISEDRAEPRSTLRSSARASRDPLQFKVERDEIPLITVPYAFEIKPGIGYVKIDRFSESTADELAPSLKNWKATIYPA